MRASPETLNRVAQQLQQVQSQCQELFRAISSVSGNLQSEWHGPGAQRFMSEFQQIQSSWYQATQRMEGMAGLLKQTAASMAEADQKAAGFSVGGSPKGAPELVIGDSKASTSSPTFGGHSSGSGAGGLKLVVNDSGHEGEKLVAMGAEVEMDGSHSGPNLTTVAGEQPAVLVSAQEVKSGGSDSPFAAYESTPADAANLDEAITRNPVPSFGGGPSVAELHQGTASLVERVVPFAQGDYDNCGRTSVAMAVNAITGSNLTDWDIQEGGSLLGELNKFTADSGYQWTDANLNADNWSFIEQSVKDGAPVVVGLNGPEFSPSGHGHIVTIVGIEGDKVFFADPAIGEIRETTRMNMLNAEQYPQGNFIMFPRRMG